MKEIVTVALLQLDIVSLKPEVNLTHALDLIDKTVSENPVDLIVLPELANSGYVTGDITNFGPPFIRVAEKIPGLFCEGLCEAAKKYNVHIVAGMLEAHPVIPDIAYNSAILINSAGKLVGIHHKLHLPGEERHYFLPGNTVDVFPTELGNIAIQVCEDSRHPELSRTFALKGAEIICTVYNAPNLSIPNWIPSCIHHVAGCRAFENACFFIGCNRAGTDESGLSWGGHSCIAGPMSTILFKSETDQEEIVRGTLKEETIRQARAQMCVFHERRPEHYGLLTRTPEQIIGQ